MPPSKFREDSFCLVCFPQDYECARKGLDCIELKRRPIVHRIRRDQEGKRAVNPVEVERLRLGGLPGAIEGDEPVVSLPIGG